MFIQTGRLSDCLQESDLEIDRLERFVNTAIDSITLLIDQRTDVIFASIYKQCIELIKSEKLEHPSLPMQARVHSSYKDSYPERV